MLRELIIENSRRIESWPQWDPGGGVIGDKVTLMFHLFNSHLFVSHLLCVQFRSQFFSGEKAMSPETDTKAQLGAFQMSRGCRVVILSTPYVVAVSQLIPFYPIVNFFPRFCIALPFSTFFQAIEKRTLVRLGKVSLGFFSGH